MKDGGKAMTTESEDINAAFDRDFDKLLAGEWKPATEEHYEPMPAWMLRQNREAYLQRQKVLDKAEFRKTIKQLPYLIGILLICWAIDHWHLYL